MGRKKWSQSHFWGDGSNQSAFDRNTNEATATLVFHSEAG